MTDWTHGEVVANGVRLHHVEAGDPDDPLVVLLHGFPEFWYSWREQIPALADAGFHVVAPDMRGYNRSEKPHGVDAYRLEELVGDVVGLLDRFDAERAHVVGHDWGGIVAWETAIRHPDRLADLAVLNAPHPGAYRRELLQHPEQWRRSSYAMAFQLPRLPEFVLGARNCAGVAKLLVDSAMTPSSFDERDLRRYREAACRPGALTSAINYYRAQFRSGLRRELGAVLGDRRSLDVDVPTLLVWGEADVALDVALTEGLDRWVDDLRVERLPDVSHWVHHERPEQVSELLVEYLSRRGRETG